MAPYTTPQPNTEETLTLLSSYLDGEVTEAERLQVEQALSDSPELTAELDELRQTVSLVSALPAMAAPRPFTLTLADVTPVSPPKKQRGWFSVPMWAGGLVALAAALVCMLAAGGLFIGSQMRGSSMAPAAEVALQQEAAAPTPPEAAMNKSVEATGLSRSEEVQATEASQLELAPAEPELAVPAPPAAKMADEAKEERAAGAAPPPAATRLPTELEEAASVQEKAAPQESMEMDAETPAQANDLAEAQQPADETAMMAAEAAPPPDAASSAVEMPAATASPLPAPVPSEGEAVEPETAAKAMPQPSPDVTDSLEAVRIPVDPTPMAPPQSSAGRPWLQTPLILAAIFVSIVVVLGAWVIVSNKRSRHY
jgi:hypothetical protein